MINWQSIYLLKVQVQSNLQSDGSLKCDFKGYRRIQQIHSN